MKIIILFLLLQIVPFRREGRITRVLDGDTIEAQLDVGSKVRIRLAEMNAPELPTSEGYRAKNYLWTISWGKNVTIICSAKDKYGRFIADVYLNGVSLSSIMIQKGYAKYVHYYNIKNKKS